MWRFGTMRNEVEIIYSQLPFNNDIKFKIYQLTYKHFYTILPQLKEELLIYLELQKIIEMYQRSYATDVKYGLYTLLSDFTIILLRNMNHCHLNQMKYHWVHSVLYVNFRNVSIQFLLKRLRRIWTLMGHFKRIHFLKNILII